MTFAPWTSDQVRALNAYQRSGWLHPFTCGHCRDTQGVIFERAPDTGILHRVTGNQHDGWEIFVLDRTLTATAAGWICPTCDYTQDWAHDWMVDRSWEAMRPPWVSK